MMLKTRNENLECDSGCSLCENPYPYNCEHCVSVLQSQEDMPMEVKEQPKMFIGSGEDVWL